MSDQLLTSLLPAIGIAAFARREDGSFAPLAPPPPWFTRLADTTFPFLGHILEEATDFWRAGVPGSHEWGPCAEVDETGREFHYLVTALIADGSAYLLFQLDTASDRVREVLQKAREQALAAEQRQRTQLAFAKELRQAREDIPRLLASLHASSPTVDQVASLETLSSRCTSLLDAADLLLDH